MEMSKRSRTTHMRVRHEMNADNSPLEPMQCAKELCNRRGQHKQLRQRDYKNKQTQSAHESSVGVLVGFYMLQVCGHNQHFVVQQTARRIHRKDHLHVDVQRHLMGTSFLCKKIFTRKMVIPWTWIRKEVVFYS